MLSVSPPKEGKMKRPNIINRNWLACALSDVVFVPFAEKATKTLSLAKQILAVRIPVFTSDHEDNEALHRLGVAGLSRKSVGGYLENLGANRATPFKEEQNQVVLNGPNVEPEDKSPRFLQGKLNF
jgi:predicted Rossmann fold nucleotide-binding protein DprA/Smf involved in DNA uptake